MKKLLATCTIAVVVAVTQVAQGAEIDKKEVIASPNAPKAIGPYSQAIRYGNLVFLSCLHRDCPRRGQVAEGSRRIPEGIASGATGQRLDPESFLYDQGRRLITTQAHSLTFSTGVGSSAAPAAEL